MFEWIQNRVPHTALLAGAVLVALSLRGIPEPTVQAGQPRQNGPDVIVGDIHDAQSYGVQGGESAFAIGTTSCNIGTAPLDWIAQTSSHPVIAQNLYRIKDGRIEQLGLSWLKHGFFALNQSLCGTCEMPGGTPGTHLGVNCSDPYSAGLNGTQANLGPRSQVNPSTGVFPFPPRRLPQNPGVLAGRLHVANTDLEPAMNAGAVYVAEAQYVHPQDAKAGNGNNNASHRIVTFPKNNNQFTLTLDTGKPTVRTLPAIYAWQSINNDAVIRPVDVRGDGRYFFGIRSTKTGAGFHHEVAIYNLNSERAARALTIKTQDGGAVSNLGFHGVKYDDEMYDSADWKAAGNGSEAKWSTDTFAMNQNANALRWGTLYSFWFNSTTSAINAVIELFKPGQNSDPAQVTVDLSAKAPARPAVAAEIAANTAAPAPWAAGAGADRNLGTNQTFTLTTQPKMDRDLEPIESSLEGLTAKAEKMTDATTRVVTWVISVQPPNALKEKYYEALLKFKTKTKDDPELTIRIHGVISKE